MNEYITLNTLPLGKKAKVKILTSDSINRRRFLDLGLISNTVVDLQIKVKSKNEKLWTSYNKAHQINHHWSRNALAFN